MKHKHKKIKGLDIFAIVVLTIISLSIVIPFWNALVISFSTEASYIKQPFSWLPGEFTLETYEYVFRGGTKLLLYYWNTIKVTVIGTAAGMTTMIMAAYVFSRKFPGKKLFFVLTLFTMYFSGGLIPSYLLIKDMGLLNSHAKKVKEAGLCENSYWGGNSTGFIKMFYGAFGLAYPEVEWIKDENGYSWLGNEEGTEEMLKEIQTWYKEGLVHPEIAQKNYSEFISMFSSGLIPVLATDGNMATVQNIAKMLQETYADKDPFDLFFGVTITTEDGTPYESGGFNYWGATVFSPETSDEVQERILDVMEYTATKEYQAERQLGYYGKDFTITDAGEVKIINEGVTLDPFGIFNTMVWTTDDFEFSGYDPTKDPRAAEMVLKLHEAKWSGVISFTGAEYAAHGTEAKNNYPAALVREGIYQITFSDKDVTEAWKQFKEDNRNLWEPLEKELNETYTK